MILTSSLPNDRDMNSALGSDAIPTPHLFTDACFAGVGEHDSSLLVAVERKKIGDLASCILNGRFMFQLQVCKEAGCDTICLIAEGRTRPNPEDGLLEVPVWGINPRTLHRAEIWQPVRPTITYSRFDQYLTELAYLARVVVKRSDNVRETVAIIKALYASFQSAPDEHQSLHPIFTAPPRNVELVRPSLLRRIVKELDGIGWKRSRDVAEHFKTVRAMANAGTKEWSKIPGIGKITASRVVASLNGLKYKK